jgi:excisionase family DNA binding protein
MDHTSQQMSATERADAKFREPIGARRRAARTARLAAQRPDATARREFPVLLTVDDAADLLRTTPRAIYVMVDRGQLPGVTRIGRRLLLRADDLVDWLDQKRAPLPKE